MGMAAYGTPCIDMLNEVNKNHHKGFRRRKWFWHTVEDIAA